MFGMLDVRDVGCWEFEMFALWDIWDVSCLGCKLFGMWDVDVGFGMFTRMWDVGLQNAKMSIVYP